MAKTLTQNTHSKLSFRWLITSAVILIAVYMLVAWVFKLWPLVKHPTPSNAQTTSTALSAQSSFKDGGQKSGSKAPEPSPTNVASDTQGSAPQNNSDSLTWSKSPDGNSIIVMGPAADSVFTSGDVLYGTATGSTVNYELEDDVSGVILQGQANVVNGKFSIKMTFSTTGTNGKINVYNQTGAGPATNYVSIPVRLK